MLRLILGRAGSGKTSYLLSEIKSRAERGLEGNILIVPEQYSHDCERALAAMGDDMCLYCEVLSFTRLATRVFAETGGLGEKTLDNGGRVLAMGLAAMNVSSALRVYNVGGRRPDFLPNLITAYDELRAAGAATEDIARAAESAGGAFGRKLQDLTLIFEAYDAVKERSGVDARDRLTRLAGDIGRSRIAQGGAIFIDGFTDFTNQEFDVILELLRCGADITVALTMGSLADTELLFRASVTTARRLLARASELHIKAETVYRRRHEDAKAPELSYLESALFDYSAPPFDGECSAVTVVAASDIPEECSAAAARVLELVRGGARFRDIAVVSPNWGNYESILEGVFRRYGVPVSQTEKREILERPVMALVTAALDIILNNWDYVNVFKYLKTNLAGIEPEERDELENYVLKWNIRGEAMWSREWTMHPGGYTEEMTERESGELERINALRARISAPILTLSRRMARGEAAIEKLRALYGFLEEIGLYGILAGKRRELASRGMGELAEEYRQLWDILIGAMQQFADICGETPVEREEFLRLLKLVLSQYKVGAIPTALDSVRAGDMTRIRARGIKHLIILGATDSALPPRDQGGGIFTESERQELRDLGIEVTDGREDDTGRELSAVYASLTVPEESIMFSYPAGERRSYIVTRIMKLLSIGERAPGEEIYAAAPGPCFELAVTGEGPLAQAARRYFEGRDGDGERLRSILAAADVPRGRLAALTSEKLYGRKPRLSASRIDMYYSCRFAYFLRYGLRAAPRREAALDAPESGTFMHFILERSVREIEARGGFGNVPEAEVRALTRDFVEEYALRRLGGIENKPGRFKYLFGRLAEAAEKVVLNMCEELRDSDFRPLDFELRFSPDGELPPVEVRDGEAAASVMGIVDRVDGYVKDGKLYLRVVDYKTGKKALNLGDIWYGIGLQMLIYLFALEREGSERYGRSIVPAGVLYAPARDEIVRSDRDLEGEELEKERRKLLKYSGLILADPEIIEAMDHGHRGKLPVQVTSSGDIKGSAADAERLGKLARTVDRLITEMVRSLKDGSVAANPYYRGLLDTACARCRYFEACRFTDGHSGERFRRLSNLKASEFWDLVEEAAK